MPTGNITTHHVSGGLGVSGFDPDRIGAKIGWAEGGTVNQPKLIMNASQAKDFLVKGELLDAVIQHFEEFDDVKGETPSPVIAIKSDGDLIGSSSVVADATNTGVATLPAIAGTPSASRSVILTITKSGAGGTAQYRKSTDGGRTFESPLVTPTSSMPIFLVAGVSASFTDATVAGDTFIVLRLKARDQVPPQSSPHLMPTADFMKQDGFIS